MPRGSSLHSTSNTTAKHLMPGRLGHPEAQPSVDDPSRSVVRLAVHGGSGRRITMLISRIANGRVPLRWL